MSNKVVESGVDTLESLGLTKEDVAAFKALLGKGIQEPNKPTKPVKKYVKGVSASLSDGTLRGYRTYFNRFVQGVKRQCSCTCAVCVAEWAAEGCCKCKCGTCKEAKRWKPAGKRPMTNGEFTRTELERLVTIAERMSAKKAVHDNTTRAARGLAAKPSHGQGGREMCVAALRCLFSRAVEDGLMDRNPAESLSKGTRGESLRRALTDNELEELLTTVVSGGDDPELDLLITWAELELGARRGGVLSLNMGRLLTARQSVKVLEKGKKEREQPLSLELLDALLKHATERGGKICIPGHPEFDPSAAVLYYRDSTAEKPHPLSSRRFDTLHQRIQLALPWANAMIYSGHALRHTTGTIIERIAGTQVARMMLGHGKRNVTEGYTNASLEEVAAAVSIMTGSPHPLAQRSDDGSGDT